MNPHEMMRRRVGDQELAKLAGAKSITILSDDPTNDYWEQPKAQKAAKPSFDDERGSVTVEYDFGGKKVVKTVSLAHAGEGDALRETARQARDEAGSKAKGNEEDAGTGVSDFNPFNPVAPGEPGPQDNPPHRSTRDDDEDEDDAKSDRAARKPRAASAKSATKTEAKTPDAPKPGLVAPAQTESRSDIVSKRLDSDHRSDNPV